MKSTATSMREISILVVEDEAITLEYLVTTLAKKYPHATICQALNGRTGLELFQKHTPDIVITDIRMPELSGLHMADKIRAIKPGTKFIVLSGTWDKIALQDSVEEGFEFDHYIEKPVDLQVLFAAIEQCLGMIGRQNRS